MDFEPWLRDQLATHAPGLPIATPTPQRPRVLPGVPAFRAGFAGAGVVIVILGLASGRTLPGLVLTSPQTRAREIPANTWGGAPSPPPGLAPVDAGRAPDRGALAPPAGSAHPGAQPLPAASGHRDDGASHPPGGGAPGPATITAPTPDEGGGLRAEPSPTPSIASTPEDGDHHGGSPTPSSRSGSSHGSGMGSSPSPSPY